MKKLISSLSRRLLVTALCLGGITAFLGPEWTKSHVKTMKSYATEIGTPVLHQAVNRAGEAKDWVIDRLPERDSRAIAASESESQRAQTITRTIKVTRYADTSPVQAPAVDVRQASYDYNY